MCCSKATAQAIGSTLVRSMDYRAGSLRLSNGFCLFDSLCTVSFALIDMQLEELLYDLLQDNSTSSQTLEKKN